MTDNEYNEANPPEPEHVSALTRFYQAHAPAPAPAPAPGLLVDGKCGPDTRTALMGRTDFVPGIDVSHHNGPIDWGLVRKAGYQYAWIKATQNDGFVDDMCEQNAIQAQAVGVRIGYYHYLENKATSASASEQANHFLDTIATYPAPDLPHILDVEDDNPPDRALYTRLCEQYMRLVGGMVYTSARVQRAALSTAHTLGQYGLWAVGYGVELPETPVGWANWAAWQHTSKGVIPGMEKNPDGSDRYFDLNKARPEWFEALAPGAAPA